MFYVVITPKRPILIFGESIEFIELLSVHFSLIRVYVVFGLQNLPLRLRHILHVDVLEESVQFVDIHGDLVVDVLQDVLVGLVELVNVGFSLGKDLFGVVGFGERQRHYYQ